MSTEKPSKDSLIQEQMKINFSGFGIECVNPNKTTVIIVAMVLVFFAVIIKG